MPERNPRNPTREREREMETPRTFQMDRKSPEAAKLRAAVSQKLLDFLGNYSDDVLAEYIVVLVCNGKQQNEARDDLEAFLGNQSGKFVAWLWDHLSKETSISRSPLDSPNLKAEATRMQDSFLDREQKPSGLLDHQTIDIPLSKDGLHESPNFSIHSSRSNTFEVSESLQQWCSSGAPSMEVDANRSLAQKHEVHQKFVPTDGNSNGATKYLLSSLRHSQEILYGGEQCQQYESQHQKMTKRNSSAVPCRPLPMPKTEAVTRNLQSAIIEDAQSRSLSMKSTSARRLPSKAMEAEAHQISQPRGNVWDRLGKPCEEGDASREETMSQREQLQNIRSIGPDARLSSTLTDRLAALDEHGDRTISSHQSERYRKQEWNPHNVGTSDHMNNSKRKRQYGQIVSGNSSSSFTGFQENHLQDKEAFPKLQRSLPVKHNQLQSLNESTTEAKRAEPHLQSNTMSQSQLDKRAFVATSMQNLLPADNRAPEQSESLSNAQYGNGNNKPMENEMLNVKLKLRQVEMDMLKLRSKQVEMNNGKLNASSGVQNNPEEDIESKTVLVTNVHFAASREALSSHFTKCGAIVKVVMLTDTITAQPKGAAYVVFASKDSVDKALSLSGTSFFSRKLTVMRKADMPPGFLVPAQQAGRHLQPWNPQPPKKGPVQRHYTSSHLQWRREQSASRENSIPGTTNGSESSDVGK